MKPGTQAERLYRWLKANPGASSIEITVALRLVNVTGRVSDLRKEGIDVACDLVDGVHRYRVREPGPLAFDWDKAS
jgi:hypothetical protein